MSVFIEILRERNSVLFWFSLLNLLTSLVLLVLAGLKPFEFGGTNAWFKPLKFALSTTILCGSLAWYSGYLQAGKGLAIATWVIVITLGFEVVYITLQAAKGQASHFNLTTPFNAFMFSLMGAAATAATLAVAYLGWQLMQQPAAILPDHYTWALRIGFVLFVVFSFQGFLMGSRLAHGVGGADGGAGLYFLNWSLSHGDLRIAHFIGMHALQILPLLAWFVFKNLKLTLAAGVLYGLLAVFVLFQALRGNSLVNF
ncbi:MAG: hypothetical protein ACFB10_10420 [Salibacteraceae bacterium]